MFIYLAHPIDQASRNDPASILCRTMVGSVSSALERQGISHFRPGLAYSLVTMADHAPDPADLRAIQSINNQAIWDGSGVVAVLPPGVPTLGTPAEIELALTYNRPVVIITTPSLADYSVQIAAWAGRGAQVRLTNEEGMFAYAPNFADALCSLPDPTKLVLGPTNDLLIARTATNAKIPSRAYQDDAGLDLAVVGEHDLVPFKYRLLPTGIKAALPAGYWGWITGRSSTWAKHRLRIEQAVIDTGYRGELMIGVTWMPEHSESATKTIMPGTRLAQYVLMPVFDGMVVETTELPGSERAESGYGSSGH